ncbi:hypothetical protein PVAND_004225 [Polypedilum vanderplanki]|uniref:Uncharacterized protein n=1 Tax=Polypedilum vanderplanki TaxID=319348 RepID=A0A9J6BXI3_POLVA|nr:hypothetical protein PVAND_004225 [Polypedilum vanderplanki]
MEINNSALELLSQAALNVQEHDAIELSKLPAKKRLTQLKLQQQQQQQLQQNAILNSVPPNSSISIIPINQTASSTYSNNNNKSSSLSSLNDRPEPMEQDDQDEEINVHDDDSPLDMRITSKHDSDSDSIRPSVIRRAPSFKDGKDSNSPGDPSSTCDPFIDEHFRRSLGTDYDLILRNKQLEQEQKQRMLEEQLILQQQHAAALQAQQQNILKLKHHKKHQIHQHHQAQAMLNVKQETQQLPIQVPVSTPLQLPIQQPQLPPTTLSLLQQKQVIITEHSDANDPMSVDDHFAKALGDTWKKIQSERIDFEVHFDFYL